MSLTPSTPVRPATTVTEITTARRRPGRPRVVKPPPDTDEQDYLAAVGRERDRVIESDHLHRLHEAGRPETLDVLWATVEGVAREAAALRWNREHAEASGVDAQKISTRRIEALSRMAALLLEGKKLGLLEADHHSSVVQRVHTHWLDAIAEGAADTLGDEATVFTARLRDALKGWEERLDR